MPRSTHLIYALCANKLDGQAESHQGPCRTASAQGSSAQDRLGNAWHCANSAAQKPAWGFPATGRGSVWKSAPPRLALSLQHSFTEISSALRRRWQLSLDYKPETESRVKEREK